MIENFSYPHFVYLIVDKFGPFEVPVDEFVDGMTRTVGDFNLVIAPDPDTNNVVISVREPDESE